MSNQNETRQLFKGALLLTFAGLISKLLSAGYRIPLQNITGDVGFYIYQQVYPILGIALIFSLYGFPSALSKLVSEQREANQPISFTSFYIPIFCILFGLGGLVFCLLFFQSDIIASWMGDPKLVLPLKVTAIIFLLLPFTSVLRGIFQGMDNMQPTAISQLVEQLLRVSIIIAGSLYIVKKGLDLYSVGTIAAVAAIVGAMGAFLVLLWMTVKYKPMKREKLTLRWGDYLKVILLYGIMISVNHMILVLYQFSDAFTMIPSLIDSGYSMHDAKVWKGIFDRGQPLIQLGTVVGSSLAIALIPSVTKGRLEKSPKQFRLHIQSMMKLSLYLSAAATVGLIAILRDVNILFFTNDIGTTSLRILAIAILLSSLAITIASILQGLSYIYHTGIYIGISFILKWLFNLWLIPMYGIAGSALATIMAITVLLVLNVMTLKLMIKDLRLFVIPWKAFIISMLGMIIFLIVMNQVVNPWLHLVTRFDYLGYVLLTVIISAIIYFVLLVRFDGFSEEELSALPFGGSLIELKQRRK